MQGNFDRILNFKANCNKEVDSYRRCYLSDCKVYSRDDSENNRIKAQHAANRNHNRNEDVHSAVGVDKTSGNKENDVDKQKEDDFI